MSNPYVELSEFASMLGASPGNLIVEFAELALETASRDIDAYCGRQFFQVVSAAREFDSIDNYRVWIDDAYAAPTVVAVDTGQDGTFSTTLTASQYVLEPRNGIGPTGQSGWPYTSICAAGGLQFLASPRPTNVRVTATWGWTTVPPAIKSACRRLAHLQYEARNAPFGAAGTPETGYIRIRDDKLTCQLLAPFVRDALLVA